MRLSKQKQDPIICYLQKSHFNYKDTDRLRVKRKMCHAITDQKKPGVIILPPHKVDFRRKKEY